MSENLTEESKKALVTSGSGFIGSKKEEVKKMFLMVLLSSECLSSTFIIVVLGVGVGLWTLW